MTEQTEYAGEVSIVGGGEAQQRQPVSGMDLAALLEIDRDEGVLVAVFPEEIEEVVTKEIAFLDSKGDRYHVVLGQLGPWGERAMDVVSPNDVHVKWWRAVAMMEGYDLIPIRWQGPIGEIPQHYFESKYVLGIRFYQYGPWFFPLEQPKLKTDSTLMEAADGDASNQG